MWRFILILFYTWRASVMFQRWINRIATIIANEVKWLSQLYGVRLTS